MVAHDQNPSQTSWYLVGPDKVILSQDFGNALADFDRVDETVTLSTPGKYTFVIIDSAEDGFVCGIPPAQCCYGHAGPVCNGGSFEVFLDGLSQIKTSGSFFQASMSFHVGPVVASVTSHVAQVTMHYGQNPAIVGWILFSNNGVIMSQDPGSVTAAFTPVDRVESIAPGVYVFIVTPFSYDFYGIYVDSKIVAGPATGRDLASNLGIVNTFSV
jgi:hypothetical protein